MPTDELKEKTYNGYGYKGHVQTVADIIRLVENGEEIVIKNKQWRTLFDFDDKSDVPVLVQDMLVQRITADPNCLVIIV